MLASATSPNELPDPVQNLIEQARSLGDDLSECSRLRKDETDLLVTPWTKSVCHAGTKSVPTDLSDLEPSVLYTMVMQHSIDSFRDSLPFVVALSQQASLTVPSTAPRMHFGPYDDRLQELREAAIDEGISILEASEHAFERFVSEHPYLRRGSLGLADEGYFCVAWRDDQRRISVQFMEDNTVEYVLLVEGERATVDRTDPATFLDACRDRGVYDLLC